MPRRLMGGAPRTSVDSYDVLSDNRMLQRVKCARDAARWIVRSARAYDQAEDSSDRACETDARWYVLIICGLDASRAESREMVRAAAPVRFSRRTVAIPSAKKQAALPLAAPISFMRCETRSTDRSPSPCSPGSAHYSVSWVSVQTLVASSVVRIEQLEQYRTQHQVKTVRRSEFDKLDSEAVRQKAFDEYSRAVLQALTEIKADVRELRKR